MNKYIFLIVVNIFISTAGWGQDKIFNCLKTADYECISFEINLNADWSQLRDKNNRDVLDVAIDLKSQQLIKYLIGKGARVEEKHIYAALKQFLGVEEADELNFDVLDEQSVLQRLILAAINDQNPHDTINKLSKILDLFAGQEELALSIYQLRTSNLIELRDVNLLLKEYSNLFLQDKNLTKKSLVNIVRILMSLGVNKWLILLVIDSYEIYDKNQILVDQSMIDLSDEGFAYEKIAYAIIEQSRNLFLSLPAAVYVRKIIIKEESSNLDNLFDYSENLNNFIISTIEYPARKIGRNLNYLTWIKIYDILLNNGDFMSAFTVGSALNSCRVEKLVGKQVYRELSLLDMHFSFKNYRQAIELFSDKFHVPAPIVIMRDLSSVGELNLFDKTKTGEIINSNALGYFTKFHNDISTPYRAAMKKKFYSSEAATNLINNLIHDHSTDEQSGFEKAYKIIWPHSNNNNALFNTTLKPKKLAYPDLADY